MAEDEGETLSRNDPLQAFLRAQREKDGMNVSETEFLASYEEHVKGLHDTSESKTNFDGTHTRIDIDENATVVTGSTSQRSQKIVADKLNEVPTTFEEVYDFPNRINKDSCHLKSIVLKFTTLSDACTEAPSFTVSSAGATIGQSETNAVCVPSDAHLVPSGHASIEFENGSFFLVDGGFDYPASIRIGASNTKRSICWRFDVPDSRFSVGSSIFCSRGLNDSGDLLLDILEGPLKGESRVLKKQTATIGRASENGIAVPDRELSRRHASIEYDSKTQRYFLLDLGSTNGTYMQLVGPHGGKYKLSLNDHILVGRTGFSVNRFDYGLSEEMGHRQTMEDACAIVQHLDIAPLNSINFSPQSFFGVYDGHGGAQASAYLSQYLHINVADALLGIADDLNAELECMSTDEAPAWERIDKLVIQVLKASFLKTDADFISTATSAHAQHGSTATTGLLLGQRLYCANVGDSRTLLCRNYEPLPMSTDHKPSRQDEAERIRNAGGFVFNNRVMGELAVSRAFGDSSLKMGITPTLIEEAGMTIENNEEVKNWDQPLIIAEPDIEVTTITENDQFFLLACDGLFDVFTPGDVVEFVRSKMEEHGDTQQCCQNLTFEAIRKRNSRDNVSVILIILNKWF